MIGLNGLTFLFREKELSFNLKEHTDLISLSTLHELAIESLSRKQSYCIAIAEEKTDEAHTFTRIYDGINFFQSASWKEGKVAAPYMTPFRTEVLDYTLYELNPNDLTPFALNKVGVETKLMYWKLFEKACYLTGERRDWSFAETLAKATYFNEPLTEKQVIEANLGNLGHLVLELKKDPSPEARTRLEYYARLWKSATEQFKKESVHVPHAPVEAVGSVLHE